MPPPAAVPEEPPSPWTRVSRAMRAARLAREWTTPERLASLARMPEVRAVLDLPSARGLAESPERLHGLLVRLLLRADLQAAMRAGAVADETLRAVLAEVDEDASVARLCELGVSREHARHALSACDGNEGLAASMLFE